MKLGDEPRYPNSESLTNREIYAAIAMHGFMISQANPRADITKDINIDILTRSAVLLADKLITALEAEPEP